MSEGRTISTSDFEHSNMRQLIEEFQEKRNLFSSKTTHYSPLAMLNTTGKLRLGELRITGYRGLKTTN
jgi:hypothetical protein